MSVLRGILATAVAVAATIGAAGCTSAPKMSPTQMDALQTREVEAAPDASFAAATNALLDAGYRIELCDADAGLLTAQMREDPPVAANVAVIVGSAVLSMGHYVTDLPPTFRVICLQVMPMSPRRSKVRIRCFENAAAKDEPQTVEQIWTLMQRQVLMKDPPTASR